MAEQNLKTKTTKGLFWGGISNGGQQLLNLVFGIFLARLLTPSDYGLVGMLAIFSLIATALQESGFISALNRKQDITQADYNAVFWFNVFMGLSAYAVLFFCAPLIAAWFHQPILVPLARLSFLSFVFSCFGTTPRAYLFRHLKVKETAYMTLIALTVSGLVGIILAWQGFAYWGIAIQNLIFCLLLTVLSWYYSGWRPSLKIDFSPLRSMIGFSVKLLLTNIFMHINNNIFSIFLGRWYGDRALGYYNQANKWTGIGYSTLTGMVWNVTQPVFARIADDRQQMQRAFRKMLRFTAFLACPCMFGLALIAPEFITISITEKWLPSAQLMQILCIGGAFVPVASLYANFLVSQGKSNVYMYNTIGLCLVQLLLLYVLYPYGIHTMVVAYVVLNLLWLPVWHTFTARLIGVSFFRAVTDVAPFVLIAALAMGGAWWAAAFVENIVAALLIKIAVAAVLYVGMMKLCKAVILEECLDFLLRRTKKQ